MTLPATKDPGMYFGLPEDEYHAAFALSNSGVKHMLVSTLDFWARSPLNPDRVDERTEFMELGAAYDTRVVSGKEAFYRHYAARVEADDYPGALRTADDIRAELKALGLKTGGAKSELIERLTAADPNVKIWDAIEAEHAARHVGKTLLSARAIHRIEVAAAMIEKHPILSKCFTGGYPQVSVFWIDEDTKVPMKARLDYLKPRAVVDLKTFSNPLDKPIDRAILSAMAGQKYHIQAALYLEAAERIAGFIRDGRVFGVPPAGAWRDAYFNAEDRQFVFVFQATGPAPVARGKILDNRTAMDCGRVAVKDARRLFSYCLEKYGADPWLDEAALETFDDMQFPAYMFDL